jgi:ribosomal protein S8
LGIFYRVKLTNFADVLRKKWKILISKLKKRKKENPHLNGIVPVSLFELEFFHKKEKLKIKDMKIK